MLMPLLLLGSLAWGPICHAVIADEFAQEYFPFLTPSQHDSYLRGAIYADGFDKRATHHTAAIVERLRAIPDNSSDLYWFFMGMFSHVPPDTFAHAGKSRSFIVPTGVRHHFSELVIDSLMMHRHPLPYFSLPAGIRKELARLNIQPLPVFKIQYPLFFILSKFPLWHIVHFLEKDKCPKGTAEIAVCNFVEHYHSMLQSLREAVPKLYNDGFNDVRVREISTRLVFDLVCCTNDSSLSAILSDEGYFDRPPLLGSEVTF
jgi:hypothetical protein